MPPSASTWGERLYALAGYYYPPTTFGAMLFYLPEFTIMARRAVRIKDRLWELWSPNSKVHAYYPGTRDDTILLGSGLPKELRRSDGHLGRFDYTMVPQHYDGERPWLGFIKKWDRDSRPENASFFDVWMLTNKVARGKFRRSFTDVLENRVSLLLRTTEKYSSIRDSHRDLWDNRPQELSVKSLVVLKNEMRLDDAIDTLVAVQRDVKELAAWNRMADSILKSHGSVTLEVPISSADDTLMGVWLNGCDEESGLWLLRNRVPCFIVREGDSDQDRERMRSISPYCVSMMALTQLKQMEDVIRNHERLLVSYGMTLLSKEDDVAIGKYSELRPSTLESRFMATPEGQGFIDEQYRDPRIHPPIVEPEYGNILEERDGKIIPPTVIKVVQTGSWTYWVESSIEGYERCMRKRASGYAKSRGGHHYYDRANKRVLYFEEELVIPRHYDADVSIFGWPVPQIPFLECSDNEQHVIQFAKSVWCYEKEAPSKDDLGRTYEVAPVVVTPAAALHESSDIDDVVSLDSSNEEELDLLRRLNPSNMSGVEPTCESSLGRTDVNETTMLDVSGSQINIVSSQSNARPLESRRPNQRNNYRRSHPRQSSRHYSPDRRSSRYHPPPRYPYADRPPPYRRSRSRSPIRRFSPIRQPRRSRSPRREPLSTRDPVVTNSPGRDPPQSLGPTSLQNAVTISTPLDLSLLSRMGPPVECVGTEDSVQIVRRDPRDAPQSMEVIPSPIKAPIPTLSTIGEGAQTKFLMLWNVPAVYCWDNILEWIFGVLKISFGATLKRIHRTNEGGYQVFWLVFASEHQATTFRGVVTDRWTKNGHLVKCDFVSAEVYGSVAGPRTDKWLRDQGYVGDLSTNETFPDDRRDQLSHPSLAERLGISLGTFVKPTKRGKRAGAASKKRKQSTDGGAL